MDEPEEITVTLGEQVFAPVSYNSFRVGPFSYTTKIGPNETENMAFDRAHNYLMECSRRAYTAERKLFWDRYEGRDK